MAMSKSAPYAYVGFVPDCQLSPTYRESTKSSLWLVRMDRTDSCTARATTSLCCCSMAVCALWSNPSNSLRRSCPLLCFPVTLEAMAFKASSAARPLRTGAASMHPANSSPANSSLSGVRVPCRKSSQTWPRSAATRRKPVACAMAILASIPGLSGMAAVGLRVAGIDFLRRARQCGPGIGHGPCVAHKPSPRTVKHDLASAESPDALAQGSPVP